MRKALICAQMITLALLLCSCGAAVPSEETNAYERMERCTMEAVVTVTHGDTVQVYTLACDWTQAESTVTIVEPKELADVQATVDGEKLTLRYEDACLDSGSVGGLSPATVLPALMAALREGYLVEESREKWGETDCRRVTYEVTGKNQTKLTHTVWLENAGQTPLHAEIGAEGKINFTLEFTRFQFGDRIG